MSGLVPEAAAATRTAVGTKFVLEGLDSASGSPAECGNKSCGASQINSFQNGSSIFRSDISQHLGAEAVLPCSATLIRRGISGVQALKHYGCQLTLFEQSEVVQVNQVWFVGRDSGKKIRGELVIAVSRCWNIDTLSIV